MYRCVRIYTWMCGYDCRCPWRPEELAPQELGLDSGALPDWGTGN